MPWTAKRWSSKDDDDDGGFDRESNVVDGVLAVGGSIFRDTVGIAAVVVVVVVVVVSTNYVSGRWVILLHAQNCRRHARGYSASASDARRICSSSGETPWICTVLRV